MRLEDYQELFKDMDTSEEFDKKIMTQVKQRKVQRKSNVQLKIAVWILAVLCVMVPVSANAQGIIQYFSKLLGKDVEGYVTSPLQMVGNEHIQFCVEQVFSDGRITQVICSYEMLDERGKNWYEYNFMEILIHEFFYLGANWNDEDMIGFGNVASLGWKTAEEVGLEEYETETKKYFLVYYLSNNVLPENGSLELQFPITKDGIQRVTIDISTRLPLEIYTLHTENDEVTEYTQLEIEVSPVGITVLGYLAELGQEAESLEKPEVKSLQMVMEDGLIIDLLNFDQVEGGYCLGNIMPREGENMIYSGSFAKPIDISAIKNIRLNGVNYELKKK